VKLHWLCAPVEMLWITFRAVGSGRYWASIAALTALHAFGTELNSPRCSVFTKLLGWASLGELISQTAETAAAMTTAAAMAQA
jgi:ribosomal protein L12E/L44/L45/RPP1/RPP2